MFIKNKIQNIFNFFGFKLERIESKQFKNLDFYTKILTPKDPVIFDVGANQGQSILRYKRIFPKSFIHCFEPISFEFEKLREKYKEDHNIVLNNFALGNFDGIEELNINFLSGHSSFNRINTNTKWIKKTSKEIGTTPENYTIKKETVNLKTIQTYCKENQISEIDILKIDTQGYEDKVLEGALELLKSQKIKLIQLEVLLTNVYDKALNIYDIEKYLIPYKYKLFANSVRGGSLHSELFQQDHIYVSSDTLNLYYKKY